MKKTLKQKTPQQNNLDFKNTLPNTKQHSQTAIRSQRLIGVPSASGTGSGSGGGGCGCGVGQMLEKDLVKEVRKVEKLLEAVQGVVGGWGQGVEKGDLEGLRQMEYEIRSKQASIKTIQLDIKQLQKGQTNPIPNSPQTQLKSLSMQVQSLLETYRKKIQTLTTLKQKTPKLQSKYISKCLKLGIDSISFEEFCNLIRKKSGGCSVAIGSENRIRNGGNGGNGTGNQDLREKNYNVVGENLGKKGKVIGDGKKVKEINSQKDVMEAALKAAKKKHLIQLSQYHNKLQFLKDEHDLLSNKLVMAQKKFKQNQARSKSKSKSRSKDNEKDKDRNQRMFRFRTEVK